MKEIPLTQGKVALVDDQDFEWLSQWSWHARKARRTFYACRQKVISVAPYKQRQVGMHNEIAKRAGISGKFTDHKDLNGLNNQRNNFRPATAQQNARNRRKQTGAKSRFKGVCTYPGGWRAQIMHAGLAHYLGVFKIEADAARAYNEMAKKLFGEFAFLNPV